MPPSICVVSAVPGKSGQDDRIPSAVGEVEVCDVDSLPMPSPVAPRPEVPRPVAPRPLIAVAATPRAAASAVEFAVAVVEAAELDRDEEDVEVAAAVTELLFEELTSPELLIALHGADALVPTPTVPAGPDDAELTERLTPPPSNVAGAAVPASGFPVEQGAGLAIPE